MEAPVVNLELAKNLGLTEEEFNEIKKLLGRVPNFVELGVFSAMWSEHCSYKNSRKLFKLFPTKGKQVLVGAGEENSGIVDIGDGLGVAFKIESHNHPSAVEPFEASATGIGGCLRDIFTTGARPVAGLGALRFGSLDNERVKFLFKEVIRGLAHYANTAEVNAVGGETYFDESYEGNPLVNAFVVGIVKHDNIVRGTAYGTGNPVYYIGGETGRDGVGGASFASKEITEESGSEKAAVAIGNPELGKRLREACLELIEKGLVVGMQDMGAAGLTCSSCETATRGGTGIEIDVALIPQREKGMTPYEILLSESQERMLAILKDGKEKKALDTLKKWNIDAVKIGKVTDDRMMRVKENGVVVCQVPAEALTKRAPLYDREVAEPAYLKEAQKLDRESIQVPDDFNKVLLQLMDSPTIASKESAYKKFTAINKDQVAVGPGSDAAVIKVKGTKKALAISVDCNGRYCYLNPYNGAMMAVAEAARNIVSSGGRPLAITDGLNFGNPMKPENYWQFDKCIQGLSAACKALDTPVISGNVSFYNENPKGAVDPTPIVGMVGLIKDADKYVTQDFKNESDLVVLLGENKADLSGSEYLYLVHKQKKGNPRIDINMEKSVQAACLEAIESGIINSAHDCSEGGLAVTLAESCITNADKMLGAVVKLDELKNKDIKIDEILFGEAPSRIVVSVNKDKLSTLEKILKRYSVPYQVLGNVTGDTLVIQYKGKTIIDLPLITLSDTWRKAIPSRL
ncbi:phosphoribosylformylglycinamidine synthase subunit PurL [bacterium]|nr:phosphoribosylformylglycinamidine synthase subunit PurL [bacterium]NIN92406.1 phosphoribosylformylglycinamidine synthase subunit PurL [bacterium]NIO18520.1 phosphoribosylformylglycinamidine synthase subunit PurL [bacterium]NIO73516.1 phosphoribosylformylglycinamidine synthase subunit PurL [bacterium]